VRRGRSVLIWLLWSTQRDPDQVEETRFKTALSRTSTYDGIGMKSSLVPYCWPHVIAQFTNAFSAAPLDD
jgi:hypothetical protein